MTKRLEILENSLKKKEDLFNNKLQNHFDTIKMSNGQPLNDKRNGFSTMKKWENQNDTLRNIDKSIDKTKDAIQREKFKIIDCESAKEQFPKIILDMLSEGVLTQWRKHPNYLFINGVDKVRLVFDPKAKKISHKYSSEITDKDEWKLFAQIYNRISFELKKNQ